VQHIVPQAQSVGTFAAWAKAPSGRTVTDYDALTIVDVGGGDLQQTDSTLKPAYRMASERRGNGTIDMVAEICCTLHNFRARLFPWKSMI